MPAPEENVDTKTVQPQEQAMREITQTDHLNKKLLTSLFKRLDEGGNSLLETMLEPDNNSEENDEWQE
ncbi:unnamed protein product, partial [Brenthis ino]